MFDKIKPQTNYMLSLFLRVKSPFCFTTLHYIKYIGILIQFTMIVKILASSGSFPAIDYNEEKVHQGVAERVELRNFGPYQNHPDLVSGSALFDYLSVYSERSSNHLKYPQFHVAFSAKGKEMDKDALMAFANQWLEKMGYAQNPLVFYFHHDTDNNHLHVVTSRIGQDGRKINHSHERRRSQSAINEIQGENVEQQAKSIVDKAMSYSFQSLGQFRSILESSSYETYEEGDNLNVKKGGGVVFQLPLSSIKDHFTMDDSEERRKRAAQIKAWLLRYKAMCYNKEELTKLMHQKFGVDLVFHGKGVGSKEFKPYGYTVVDHHSKTVFKGSDVLPLKQLLEFLPYSREEKEKEIMAFIDDAIQRNNLITTKELNKLLKKQTNAYVGKGLLVLNGKKIPLKENLARILKNNDKLAWVQSFSPRNQREVTALTSLFKVNPDYLSPVPAAPAVDPSFVDTIKQIADVSDLHSFRDNLSQNGFTLFKSDNEYYVISFKMNVIANAKECGVGESLLEPPSRQQKQGDIVAPAPGLLDGVDVSLPDVELGHAVDKMVNVTEGILSMGDTSGGIGGGGPKDISKKKKKKDDRDREGRGRGY